MTPHDFNTPDRDDNSADHTAASLPPQSVDEALDEIDRILHRMLLLAELSASGGAVDRDLLQKTIERLKKKIDQIADSI